MSHGCGYDDTLNKADSSSPVKSRIKRLIGRKKRLEKRIDGDGSGFSRKETRLRKTNNKLADSVLAKTPGLTEMVTADVYGKSLSPKENKKSTRKLNRKLKASDKTKRN